MQIDSRYIIHINANPWNNEKREYVHLTKTKFCEGGAAHCSSLGDAAPGEDNPEMVLSRGGEGKGSRFLQPVTPTTEVVSSPVIFYRLRIVINKYNKRP